MVKKVAGPIKIDLGCGSNKKGADWIGCDQYKMPGVDKVFPLGSGKWPFKDNSVDEANASHVLEHLTNFGDKWERTHFFNELYRVMKPGSKMTLTIPHWCSNRYYGDPTHKEPFSEMAFYYLSRDMRAAQAPHSDVKWNENGYDCDFEATCVYSLHPAIIPRNQEYQQNALSFYKEAAQDIIATLVKKQI
jgi:predicted SAM-dependent methyltransferase